MWKRPVRLRDEAPPDDAIVVVRGGLMAPAAIERTCKRNHALFGFYGVSVFATLDMALNELCQTEDAVRRYPRIRTARCADVRRSGFPLLPTGKRPHLDIVLPDLGEETLDRLAGCFGPDDPNPARP